MSDSNYCQRLLVAREHLPQALDLVNAFQGAINPTNRAFDLRLGFQIAQDLPQWDVNYTRTEIQNHRTIEVGELVETLMMSCMDWIMDVGTDAQQVRSAVTNVFCNLKAEQGSAWVFWEEEAEHETKYNYNLILAAENARADNMMNALIVGFQVRVLVGKERLLCLTPSDSATFSVTMPLLGVVQFPQTGAQATITPATR